MTGELFGSIGEQPSRELREVGDGAGEPRIRGKRALLRTAIRDRRVGSAKVRLFNASSQLSRESAKVDASLARSFLHLVGVKRDFCKEPIEAREELFGAERRTTIGRIFFGGGGGKIVWGHRLASSLASASTSHAGGQAEYVHRSGGNGGR